MATECGIYAVTGAPAGIWSKARRHRAGGWPRSAGYMRSQARLQEFSLRYADIGREDGHGVRDICGRRRACRNLV